MDLDGKHDDGFDDLFDKTASDSEQQIEKEWIVLKVPKRKELLKELSNSSSELVTWSDGTQSLCINAKFFDIIESQDKRDIYGLVDSTSASIHIGFKCGKAVLRPTLNAISKKDLQDEKKSRIIIAHSGSSKSSAAKKDAKKDRSKQKSKNYSDDIEEFLEEDSYSE